VWAALRRLVRANTSNDPPVSLVHGVLQTVFPLIYLLLKRHYEIMRAMRTKVLDSRELGSGVESFGNVNDVIRWRMNDLTSASLKVS
jgi:hypothetical protein